MEKSSSIWIKQCSCRPGRKFPVGWAAVLLCAGLLQPACMRMTPCCDESVVIHEAVRFFPSRNFDCGPTALAMLLNHEGCLVVPEEVEQAIGSERVRGTLTSDVEWYAREQGFHPNVRNGTVLTLQHELEQGNTVLVLVDQGMLNLQKDHYMLVVGYCVNGIIAHTGTSANECVPLGHFTKQWKRNNGWMMTLNAPAEAP